MFASFRKTRSGKFQLLINHRIVGAEEFLRRDALFIFKFFDSPYYQELKEAVENGNTTRR